VKSRKQKNDEVEYLKAELAEATNVVVVQYKGLTVEQDTTLRNKIRESGSRYRVVKNTLANIAAEGTPAGQISDSFNGPTAIAYNSGDPVALAKVLSDYAKDHPIFEFRAGLVDGRVVEMSALAEIAALPSYEELLAKLMYLLNSGAQRIAVGINGVARNMAVALSQAVEQKKFSE